jgi:7-carboxy-7-deazaguanine synthase
MRSRRPAATYAIARDGVFWTIQGEGAMVGEPMAFVRFAGCSVGCPQCDTDYRVSSRVTLAELMTRIHAVVPAGFQRPWVWLTGGEPTDQHLEPVMAACLAEGLRVAVATSGVRRVPALTAWISVSPHSPSIAQTWGHELKIIPTLNGMALGADDPTWAFAHRFIQPPAGDIAATAACVAFVQTHPGWRLSVQSHKILGIP